MAGAISHLNKTRELLKKAPYDPFYGIRLITLDQVMIGDVCTCLSHAQVDPGKAIVAHMHEHNDEICQALSDLVIYLGKPVLTNKGKYRMDGDKVMVEWDDPIVMQSGDTVSIPEGIAHCFVNPSGEKVAHIQFVIPKNHFTPVKMVLSTENPR